jgi:glutamyl-tRNA reductase
MMGKPLHLLVVGISHKTAPIEVRECFAAASEEIPGLLRTLCELETVHEALLLSTCNRVEVYAVPGDDPQKARQDIVRVMATERGLDQRVWDSQAYTHSGREAMCHLLRVATSLDSLVVGEPQILGQLKEAWVMAQNSNSLGKVLAPLLEKTFRAAKAVRSQTGIGRDVVSIGSVAVDLAQRIFTRLDKCRVLLIGAGKMAEATAFSLANEGVARVYVANRSAERAQNLAAKHGWKARALDELEDLLAHTDVVISSTGSARHIIGRDLIQRVIKARKYRPLFLMDIAVPRDIDPLVSELDTVFLYNVDDLEGISQTNLESRRREADAAEVMVQEALDKVDAWSKTLKVQPTLAAIRQRADTLAKAELEYTLEKRLSHLGVDDKEAVEKMVGSLVTKILHPTMNALREDANGTGETPLVGAARTLHGLDGEDAE